MKVLDLFSGIGGFSLAARWMNWETIAFCEIDKFCTKVLNKNFPGVKVHSDVKKIKEFENYEPDVVVGGFPCQPFSVAGKQRGQDDNRFLWPQLMQIVEKTKPDWCVFENVSGIINMALDQVLSDLENANYSTQCFIVPACGVDAWHKRNRVWIVANNIGKRLQRGKNNRRIGEVREKSKQFITRCDNFNVKQQSVIPNIDHRGKQNETSRELSSEQLYISNGKEESGKEIKSEFLRSVDGIPGRLDITGVNPTIADSDKTKNRGHRIKALGNSIVPQIAYIIFKYIQETEDQFKEIEG